MISAGLNEATAGAALQEPFDSFSVTFNVQTSDQRRPVNIRLHFYQLYGDVTAADASLTLRSFFPLHLVYIEMVGVNMIIRYNMQRFICVCAQRAPFLNGNVTCPTVRSLTVLNQQLNQKCLVGLIELMHF